MTLRFGTDGVRGVAEHRAHRRAGPRARARRGPGARRRAAVRRRPRHAPFGPDARGRARRRAVRRGRRRRARSACCPRPASRSSRRAAALPAAVISASHNPFADNGIKLFARRRPQARRRRSRRAIEAELRGARRRRCPSRRPEGSASASSTRAPQRARRRTSRTSSTRSRAAGSTGCASCSTARNGAAFRRRARACCGPLGADGRRAPRRARRRATSTTAAARPTPSELQAAVRRARRRRSGWRSTATPTGCIAVDERGELVDGDQIIAVCRASTCTTAAQLRDDTIVVTVMSNLGLAPGAASRTASTWSRRRSATATCSRRSSAATSSLGGEQSGHVIFRDLATTGDGLLTGMLLLDVVRRAGPPAVGAAPRSMTRLPAGAASTCAVAPRRRSTSRRALWRRGRAASRPSSATTAGCSCGRRGTEPLVRVMVEAPTPRPRPTRRPSALRRPWSSRGVAGPAPSPPGAFGRRCAGSSRSCVAGARRVAVPDAADLARRRSIAAARAVGRARALTPASTADRAGASTRPPRSRRGGRPRAARASPVCGALLGDPSAGAALERPRRPSSTQRLDASSATLDAVAAAARGADARGASTPRWSRCKDAVWAVRRDRLRTARGGRRPRRRRRRRSRRIEALHSVQVALSALDRLEVRGRDSAGLHLLVARPRPRPRRPDDRAVCSSGAPTIRCSRRRGARAPTATSRSSTRRRPRSASSATTPRRCAPRSATTSCCAWRSRPTTAEAVGARPHPLGERRHHLRANAHPLNQRGARRRPARPYVVGRAQRRRRQLRRPQGARRRCASRPRSPPTPR